MTSHLDWGAAEAAGAVGGGEGVAEVATMAVGAGVAGEDYAAGLRLVAWVADHRAELADAVGELAVVAVGALPGLLPLVAQLCLEHPLVVHLQFQGRRFIWAWALLARAPAANVHPLLLPTKRHTWNVRFVK